VGDVKKVSVRASCGGPESDEEGDEDLLELGLGEGTENSTSVLSVFGVTDGELLFRMSRPVMPYGTAHALHVHCTCSCAVNSLHYCTCTTASLV